ncbi:uncharacterized protein ARMOST_12172 [Armillaria ostoyae]|uniref:Uncharacterized protein n=1 Tax=Armillaria ostoyae TaxID=47428 RepID=A0A284RJ83_ARMOS|nr:uncharacterized protein ARMOST_12172 [Armillaria ostoyae]
MEEAAMIMPMISSLTIHDFAKETEPVTMTILSIVAAHKRTDRPCASAKDRIGAVYSVSCDGIDMELWVKVAKLNTTGADESKLHGSAVPRCSGFFTARAADCIPWSRISRKNNAGDSLPDDTYSCFDPND